MRYFIALLILGSCLPLYAESVSPPGLILQKAPIDRDDLESIKRGAKFFATNCLSCHTMVYLRYDKIANDAGITYDRMPTQVKAWPFGITPPDMSLETDVRGVDWVYTYLHSFYQDATRPTGSNNLLVPNTAMPGIISIYQGTQVLVMHPAADYLGRSQWYDYLKLVKQGSMSPEEFDQAMTDVVNFLAYAAEPFHSEQRQLGWWVLGFLSVMIVLTVLLKREYWKDVKKNKRK
jgi:ubiquinol-cytochrome c reductase cytochrome c1 subunit